MIHNYYVNKSIYYRLLNTDLLRKVRNKFYTLSIHGFDYDNDRVIIEDS